jgi:Transposase DDE domain group 1
MTFKVEFHFGELFPRVGFIVTNLTASSRAVMRFYNKRGTAEQWIKEGKQAVALTRLSCHRFRANQVRLWLSIIAYNLMSLAKYSYNDFVTTQLLVSFPRACLARARNPESAARTGQKTGILRAAATRENDRQGIPPNQNRHYDMQGSIGNLWRRLALPKAVAKWSLTSLQQHLVKTGGRLIKHARYY